MAHVRIERSTLNDPAVLAALAAAATFGASTPLAKALLAGVHPTLLAGLLYLGAGVGLALLRLARRTPRVRLERSEWGWLAGAVGAGGIVAPLLLLHGLSSLPASGASLLLNAEAVATALIAWIIFRENVGWRVGLGMLVIVAGALVLSWPTDALAFGSLVPTLEVLGACVLWGVDNNLTRKVSTNDSTWLAMVKGLVSGVTNTALGLALGALLPPLPALAGAMVVGFVGYGLSLALFVVALRGLGTARTGAYFSVAPFFGAALALAMGEPGTWQLAIAGALMGLGVWLHLSESHDHPHAHEALTHSHWHTHHDGHHTHTHDEPVPRLGHAHPHEHEPVEHSHPHYPDVHHRHSH